MSPQFNKRVAENARDVFPRNTQCHTMHSVAMRGYSWTLRDNIKPEVYAFLKEQDSTVSQLDAAVAIMTSFFLFFLFFSFFSCLFFFGFLAKSFRASPTERRCLTVVFFVSSKIVRAR